MSQTYLTTDQLAELIHYDARTIRTRLKDAVLLETSGNIEDDADAVVHAEQSRQYKPSGVTACPLLRRSTLTLAARKQR